ncbi:MAG: hypothetical protein U0744_17585 [Gemmataceae bacterium]
MNCYSLCVFLAFTIVSLAIGQDQAPNKDKAKADAKEQIGLTDLRAETDVLQLMYDLGLTVPQLKRLQEAAKRTAGKFRSTSPSRSSKEYVEKLTELRDALSDPQDADGIEDLLEDVANLAEENAPELNTRFDLTKESRNEAKMILKSLSPRQIAGYLALVKDDLLDPRETLIESLASVRQLQGEDWKNRREEMAGDVAGAAAGIDEKMEARMKSRVLALLVKSHDLSEDDFAKQRDALEKEARDLFGSLTGMDVLRNEAEYALAKLLSNPKLTAALKRRLKNEVL